jgi:hypothetical protein
MNRQQLGDCFYFYDYRFIYQQVDPVSNLYSKTVVDEGKGNLDKYVKPPISEFLRKASFIGTLQQAWPQNGMHPHGRIHHLPAYIIDLLDSLSVVP